MLVLPELPVNPPGPCYPNDLEIPEMEMEQIKTLEFKFEIGMLILYLTTIHAYYLAKCKEKRIYAQHQC